uniref:VASt domain-containing protein n=1 Tax=Chromera velia CCMP2878 TaxID=1169474 RepID=A0A0G4GB56_9ALVE|eukprot:Cvel_21106.t1-p1 / transcript=Cvel_21106.t1 / gene=Cvel_21106 / organism=Chromera_velia_CCMP2878 / gene_product=hypothetical protein / transcript_product=hypothetical protein / location=Cvel_scaffold1952:24852-28269(-) / protein_length=1043 / sequence_SO=supercontig / SO=protein_coding / is_pseudo=false
MSELGDPPLHEFDCSMATPFALGKGRLLFYPTGVRFECLRDCGAVGVWLSFDFFLQVRRQRMRLLSHQKALNIVVAAEADVTCRSVQDDGVLDDFDVPEVADEGAHAGSSVKCSFKNVERLGEAYDLLCDLWTNCKITLPFARHPNSLKIVVRGDGMSSFPSYSSSTVFSSVEPSTRDTRLGLRADVSPPETSRNPSLRNGEERGGWTDLGRESFRRRGGGASSAVSLASGAAGVLVGDIDENYHSAPEESPPPHFRTGMSMTTYHSALDHRRHSLQSEGERPFSPSLLSPSGPMQMLEEFIGDCPPLPLSGGASGALSFSSSSGIRRASLPSVPVSQSPQKISMPPKSSPSPVHEPAASPPEIPSRKLEGPPLLARRSSENVWKSPLAGAALSSETMETRRRRASSPFLSVRLSRGQSRDSLRGGLGGAGESGAVSPKGGLPSESSAPAIMLARQGSASLSSSGSASEEKRETPIESLSPRSQRQAVRRKRRFEGVVETAYMEAVRMKVPLSISTFFDSFLAHGCPHSLIQFHESQGAEDLKEFAWEGCDRELNFKQAVSPRVPFMPTMTRIEQSHRAAVLSVLPSSEGSSVCVTEMSEGAEGEEGGRRRVLFLEIISEALDVPFAESFLVLQQWALWEGGEEPPSGVLGSTSDLSSLLWKEGRSSTGLLEGVEEEGSGKGFPTSSFLVVETAVLLHKRSVFQAQILKRGVDDSARALNNWKQWASAPMSALAGGRRASPSSETEGGKERGQTETETGEVDGGKLVRMETDKSVRGDRETASTSTQEEIQPASMSESSLFVRIFRPLTNAAGSVAGVLASPFVKASGGSGKQRHGGFSSSHASSSEKATSPSSHGDSDEDRGGKKSQSQRRRRHSSQSPEWAGRGGGRDFGMNGGRQEAVERQGWSWGIVWFLVSFFVVIFGFFFLMGGAKDNPSSSIMHTPVTILLDGLGSVGESCLATLSPSRGAHGRPPFPLSPGSATGTGPKGGGLYGSAGVVSGVEGESLRERMVSVESSLDSLRQDLKDLKVLLAAQGGGGAEGQP